MPGDLTLLGWLGGVGFASGTGGTGGGTMPTQAIAAYGTQLRLSDGIALAPLAISAATNATPIVLTTPAHGIAVGNVSWVDVTGVLGNLGANGSWVAEALTTTTLRLRGSSGSGAYTSGGTATRRGTFTVVAELVNLTPIGIQFNMVDSSAHDGNGWGSSVPTMKSGPDMRVELNLVPDNPTHDEVTGLLFLALNKISRDFLVVFPDAGKSAVAFKAFVSDHGAQTPVEGLLRATPVLSIDGQMLWAMP